MIHTQSGDEFAQIEIRIHEAVSRVWSGNCGSFHPGEAWAPPVNVYRCEQCIDVCVDLAGVEPSDIEVQVMPGRLEIRGVRLAPEPGQTPARSLRIVSMEIDHGPFSCTVAIPDRIDVTAMRTTYERGLLWIRLPLRPIG